MSRAKSAIRGLDRRAGSASPSTALMQYTTPSSTAVTSATMVRRQWASRSITSFRPTAAKHVTRLCYPALHKSIFAPITRKFSEVAPAVTYPAEARAVSSRQTISPAPTNARHVIQRQPFIPSYWWITTKPLAYVAVATIMSSRSVSQPRIYRPRKNVMSVTPARVRGCRFTSIIRKSTRAAVSVATTASRQPVKRTGISTAATSVRPVTRRVAAGHPGSSITDLYSTWSRVPVVTTASSPRVNMLYIFPPQKSAASVMVDRQHTKRSPG